MSRTKLIATKRLRYGTRALAAGDHFEAPSMDAKLLVYAVKKAKFAKDEPAPKAVAPRAVISEEPELEGLRASARRLGISVDNRWGVRRLDAEIAAKRTVMRGPV
jgi:hypothetical protein